MAQEGKIGLTIDRKIWKRLSKLKIDNDFKTFDDVLIYLLTTQQVAPSKSAEPTSDNNNIQ